MREFALWMFKVIALSLGIAGWVTYFILWSGVRIYGSMNLSFGEWGPSWMKWFETWIEPLVLVSIIAVITWALFHEMKHRVPSISWSAETTPNPADVVPGDALRTRRAEEAKEIIPGIPRHERLFSLFYLNKIRRSTPDDSSLHNDRM